MVFLFIFFLSQDLLRKKDQEIMMKNQALMEKNQEIMQTLISSICQTNEYFRKAAKEKENWNEILRYD